MRSPFVVGLTGGIGSGKSTVAAAFAAKGADVLDADDVAHAVSRRGEAGHRAIVDALGREFEGPDGELDRARLRRRAFDDAAFRAWLEALLHPLIEVRIDAEINRWCAAYGVLVVPLLLERGGLRHRAARVLVVDCPEDEQVRRVQSRSGLAEAEIRRIMATQFARAERVAQADDVIDNSGRQGAIGAQVDALDRRYRSLARQADAARKPDKP